MVVGGATTPPYEVRRCMKEGPSGSVSPYSVGGMDGTPGEVIPTEVTAASGLAAIGLLTLGHCFSVSPQKIHKIFVAFLLFVVYDIIAKYGMPLSGIA